MIAFDVALDPAVEPDLRFDGRAAITLTKVATTGLGSRRRDLSLLYVATPEVLALYGRDIGAIAPGTDVVTVETGELSLSGGTEPSESVRNVETISGGYTSLPSSFTTLSALRQRNWQPARAGLWLVETSSPLTGDQIAAAREMAAAATTLTIETRDHREGLATLRSGATAVGMLLALGVLAMTVGLVRSEAAGDLRILTATGATSTTRRTLTAATAGALALLGAALGTASAYLGVVAGYLDDLGSLNPVPVLHLAIVFLGLPSAASWLLAGSEPVLIARQPLE